MKIRVLHVLDKIDINSGVSSVVMNYYSRLDHSRITFDFMLNEDISSSVKSYLKDNGSRVFILPNLKAVNTYNYIKSLREFYNNNSYEIIHGHVANSAMFYLGLARNVPYRIIHSHSIKSSDILWKRLRNWILTRFNKHVANIYVACSPEAAQFSFGKNIDVTIINNAINVERFSFNDEKRTEIRSLLKLKDEIVIGHVGRFNAVKNHSFLIDVFYDVYKCNNSMRLVLIGNGCLFDDIVKKVNGLGLNEVVLFLGSTDNVGAYMNAMDMLALPSLFEGLGLVGVEAQASGLKVLASEFVPRTMDVTGNVEFIKLDKAIWFQKIIKFQRNLDRQEQGNRIKGSRFDIDTQIQNLCEYYNSILTNK